MNYTPLEQAYQIHHTCQQTYGGSIKYSTECIYCKNPKSISLMNTDGGAFRQCERCRKNFKANILNNAIPNYSYSTYHLKGTN
jgi:hypothetical protein